MVASSTPNAGTFCAAPVDTVIVRTISDTIAVSLIASPGIRQKEPDNAMLVVDEKDRVVRPSAEPRLAAPPCGVAPREGAMVDDASHGFIARPLFSSLGRIGA